MDKSVFTIGFVTLTHVCTRDVSIRECGLQKKMLQRMVHLFIYSFSVLFCFYRTVDK